MVRIDTMKAKTALLRKDVQLGVFKYKHVMDQVYQTNVSTNLEFQRLFNGYYIIRQRPARFYESYYSYILNSRKI